MPKSGRDPYRGRPCKYCKGRFVPVTKNKARADEQVFCCDAHRKEFWRSGSLPFEKLMIRFEKRCREIAREEINTALDAALLRLRESPLVHENLQRMIKTEIRGSGIFTTEDMKQARRTEEALRHS